MDKPFLNFEIWSQKKLVELPIKKTSTTLSKNFLDSPIPPDFGCPPTIQNILLNDWRAAAVDSPFVDLLSFIILILSCSDMYSQCSMLSAIMESDQEYEAAKGLNRGIVYLMSIPYILVGLIIWKIYRTNKSST